MEAGTTWRRKGMSRTTNRTIMERRIMIITQRFLVDKFILELKTKLGDYDHNGDIDFLIVLPVFL